MYNILNGLLKDRKSDIVFKCFGLWHLIYLLLFIVITIVLIIKLNNKEKEFKLKTINLLINIAFGLYILDFFLMPFAYGQLI